MKWAKKYTQLLLVPQLVVWHVWDQMVLLVVISPCCVDVWWVHDVNNDSDGSGLRGRVSSEKHHHEEPDNTYLEITCIYYAALQYDPIPLQAHAPDPPWYHQELWQLKHQYPSPAPMSSKILSIAGHVSTLLTANYRHEIGQGSHGWIYAQCQQRLL